MVNTAGCGPADEGSIPSGHPSKSTLHNWRVFLFCLIVGRRLGRVKVVLYFGGE